MVSRDLGNGFRAVPRDAVTLNGMALPQLNTMTEPYNGYWHVIAPNGERWTTKTDGLTCIAQSKRQRTTPKSWRNSASTRRAGRVRERQR